MRYSDTIWRLLRGAIIKKKTKKFGKNSLMGGGVKIKKIKSQFQFGNFEGPGGGGLNFSKMSQFQLFDSIYAILPLYEMSEIQKCPNLIRGGGQQFSKMSEIQKSLKNPTT